MQSTHDKHSSELTDLQYITNLALMRIQLAAINDCLVNSSEYKDQYTESIEKYTKIFLEQYLEVYSKQIQALNIPDESKTKMINTLKEAISKAVNSSTSSLIASVDKDLNQNLEQKMPITEMDAATAQEQAQAL